LRGGGHNSYMSIVGLSNSLMLDFRCLIIPRFVYATSEDFQGDRVPRPDLVKRIKQLARPRRPSAILHEQQTHPHLLAMAHHHRCQRRFSLRHLPVADDAARGPPAISELLKVPLSNQAVSDWMGNLLCSAR